MAERDRIDSIDLLRGLVMVLMALDHTREFFGIPGINPRDPTLPALFLTRWVTHLCAPVFVFLAGTSAFLYGNRGRSKSQLSRFLFTRGLWLIVLEFSVVHFGWTFNFSTPLYAAGVIWAIGWSMVVLSGLVQLPLWLNASFGIALIAGHNLLDGVRPEDLGVAGDLWRILHEPGRIRVASGLSVYIVYPLVPWIGVIAAGYALGPAFLLDADARRRLFLRMGAAACVAFLVLRYLGVYGDSRAWTSEFGFPATVLSFLNPEKYPPSLLFLLMTLGPSLLLLAWLEPARGRVASAMKTIGRVPLFYYLLHLPLIHLIAVFLEEIRTGDSSWLFITHSALASPDDYGYSLPVVYGLWIVVVLVLYPACRWFDGVKRRHRDWWLSYL